MRKTAKRVGCLFLSLASCLALGLALGVSGIHGEATHVKADGDSSIDVSVASGVSMNGLELTLTKGGTSITSKVSDGKFQVAGAKAGDKYAVSAKVNGVMVSLGDLTIKEGENSFDPSEKIGKGNGGTLNLSDSSYVYKGSNALGAYKFTLNDSVSGDACLVSKIKISSDVISAQKQVLFGVSLDVGSKQYWTDIWLQNAYTGNTYYRSAILANGENKANVFKTKDAEGWALTDYGTALTGDGLYFAIQYDSVSGRIKTYLGTSADSMAYLYDWSGAGGWSVPSGSSITGFSLGVHQNWGTSGYGFDVNYSSVGFGSTIGEAFGNKASDVSVTIPDNVKMDGLELALTQGATIKKATVSNNSFTVEGAAAGDVYSVSAKINGAMTSLGELTIKKDGNSFDPRSALGSGNGGTLDLAGSSYVYKFEGKAKTYYDFSLSEAHAGDAYLAAKISISEDSWSYTRGGVQSLFGLSLTIGGTHYFTDIWLSGDRAAIIANGVNKANVFVSGSTVTDYGTALKGTGLWLAVRYDSVNGKIKTYIGADAGSMTYFCDWDFADGNGEGWHIDPGLSVTGYSLGHHKEWGTSDCTAFGVNYSNVGFGSTLGEALGNQTSDVDVSVSSDMGMEGLELTLAQGANTQKAIVSDDKFTIKGAAVGDVYSVSAKINGAMTYLGDLIARASGTSFNPSEKIGKGNGGTLNLKGSSYVYKYDFTKSGSGVNSFSFPLSQAKAGGAYLAAKISVDPSVITGGKEVLFGLSLTVGGADYFTDLWLQGTSRGAILANGENKSVFLNGSALNSYGTALTGSGFYLAIQYDSVDGRIKTYIGTSPDNMAYLHDWNDASNGYNPGTGLSVTGYSLGRHKEKSWGDTVSGFDVTFSNVCFGGTLAEAVGGETGTSAAITYAKAFASSIGCDSTGASAPSGWSNVKTVWESLSSEAKAVLKFTDLSDSGIDSDIKTCLERYEYIVSKYGSSDPSTYNDFMGRNVPTGGTMSKSLLLNEKKEDTASVIAIVSLTSVFAFASFLFLRKKKKEN